MRGGEALPQPIERCVAHLLHLIIRTIKGGGAAASSASGGGTGGVGGAGGAAAIGLKLTEKEVEHFLRGYKQ